MLKTKTFFAHPITKPPASTLEFKDFDFILQQISVIPEKNGKSAPTPPSWLLLCLGRPMTCSNAYVKHFAKFPDFFKTQCWKLCLHCNT